MFGSFYATRDLALAGRESRGFKMTRCEYAEHLLVELLNRAAVLESGAYWRAFDSTRKDTCYIEKLESLKEAVELFIDDCREARARARRARLVTGELESDLVCAYSDGTGDPELDRFGGELLTEKQIDAEESAEVEAMTPAGGVS